MMRVREIHMNRIITIFRTPGGQYVVKRVGGREVMHRGSALSARRYLENLVERTPYLHEWDYGEEGES